MASYHLDMNVGSKGGKTSASAHAQYIGRTGKYEGFRERDEKLEAREVGNMPKWAAHDSSVFWNASDTFERENGSTYREIEAALPNELTAKQRTELVRDLAERWCGKQHAFEWSIHMKASAITGEMQPHVHLMRSDRMTDGIERDPAEYFKRANSKNPEKGGCRKATGGQSKAERAADLVQLRADWAAITNKHLERYAHEARVDHRSYRERGIDRQPEVHLGPRRVAKLTPEERDAIVVSRAAENELQRSRQAVRSIIPDMAAELRAQYESLKVKVVEITTRVKSGIGDFRAQFEAHKKEQAHKAEQERQKRIEQELAQQALARKAEQERRQQVLDSMKREPEPERAPKPRAPKPPGYDMDIG